MSPATWESKNLWDQTSYGSPAAQGLLSSRTPTRGLQEGGVLRLRGRVAMANGPREVLGLCSQKPLLGLTLPGCPRMLFEGQETKQEWGIPSRTCGLAGLLQEVRGTGGPRGISLGGEGVSALSPIQRAGRRQVVSHLS